MSLEFESRLQEIAQKTPYRVEAFHFVLQALPQSDIPHSLAHHINASELCWRLHDQAIASFGPSARSQLESWGIRSTNDFGVIVFCLIDESLAAGTDEDAIEDFQGIFDFDRAFHAYRNASINDRRFQWKLSTLFVITTIFAVALAGAAKLGMHGAIGTLFSSWLGLIGGYCLFLGIVDRTRGWLLACIIGACFLAMGLGGFLAIVMFELDAQR